MKSLSTEKWGRWSALERALRDLSEREQREALEGMWAKEKEDPAVLSLLQMELGLPSVSPLDGDDSSESAGTRCGDCVLGEVIGQGGMGVVYRAQQQVGSGTRQVAVKLIHPRYLGYSDRALRLFEAEMGRLTRLEHEAIARLYAGGVCEGMGGRIPTLYFAMEYIDGLPITTYADAHELSLDARLALFLRVCKGVEYAHERRVMHCDLKPQNILVTTDADGSPRPRVIDFGLARLVEAGAKELACGGTLGYMSPEQLRPERYGPPSPRSDLYALGLILYELLAGRHAYALALKAPRDELITVMLNYPPEPLGTHREACQGELERVVAKAVAQDPDARYARVDVFRSAIQRCMVAPGGYGVEHGGDGAGQEEVAGELAPKDQKRLAKLLRELEVWQTAPGRVAFVRNAWAGHARAPQLLAQLNLDGDAWTTAGQVVRLAQSYGEISTGSYALGVLFRDVAERVSVADKTRIEEVLDRYGL